MQHCTSLFCFLLFLSTSFAQSPILIADINPGANDGISEWENGIFSINGIVLWVGQSDDNGTELFAVNNGSAYLVKDIHPGNGSSDPQAFTYYKDALYFAATGADDGQDIYRTDGTSNNTELVIELEGGGGSEIREMVVSASGELYFTYNDKLYMSDGTQSGTQLVNNAPAIQFAINFNPNSPNFARYNGGIVFSKDGASNSFDVFEVQGSEAEKLFTFQGSSFSSDLYWLSEVSDGLIFIASDNDADIEGLYAYSKSQNDVTRISELRPSRLKEFEFGKYIFPATGGTYATDGTASGTIKILDTQIFPTAGGAYIATRVGNQAVFVGGGGSFGEDLRYYITDGSVAGTTQILEQGRIIGEMVRYGDHAFWIVDVQGNRKPAIFSIKAGDTQATELYSYPENLGFSDDIILMGASEDKIFLQSNQDASVGRELYSMDHNLEITTNVIEESKTEYRIFHNPESASFQINAPGDELNFEVSISDLSGKLISTFKAQKDAWQKLPVTSGVFVISVRGNQGLYSTLVIQH